MFVSRIDRVAHEVQGISPSGAPRGALVDALAAMGRLRGALEATEAAFAAAITALGDKGADAATVLRSATKCSGREADSRVRRAEALAAMPSLTGELSSGRIPAQTIDALVRAAKLISPEAVESDSRLLANSAAKPADLAVRDVRDWIRRHQHRGAAEQRLDRQREARRGIWFTNTDGMVVCNVEFDPVTGAGIRTRLDAETDALWRSDGGRDGSPNEIRTPAQRRCDALSRLLGVVGPHSADGPAKSSVAGHVAATVVVVADIGVLTGDDPEGRCEIIDTGSVPVSVIAALPDHTVWCGALFDGPGRPLWLGRGRRLANSHQKLMAAVRDHGCVNCGAPVSRCQTHHTQPWQLGGATDIDHLALLCQRCHTLAHEGHIRLHQLPDGNWVAVPQSVDQGPGAGRSNRKSAELSAAAALPP